MFQMVLTAYENMELSAIDEGEEAVVNMTTAAPDHSGLIIFVLVLITILLIILTLTMMTMLVRQQQLFEGIEAIKKNIGRLAKSAEIMPAVKKDNNINQRSTAAAVGTAGKETGHTESEDIPVKYNGQCRDGQGQTSDSRSNQPVQSKGYKAPEGPEDKSGQTVELKPLTHIIEGLSVNASIHYIKNGPVKFDIVSAADAVYQMYSDMSVYPHQNCFLGFNSAGYFNCHDFTAVFDFRDEDGRDIQLGQPVKLLRTYQPAKVKYTQDGVLLVEKGILIAEEKIG